MSDGQHSLPDHGARLIGCACPSGKEAAAPWSGGALRPGHPTCLALRPGQTAPENKPGLWQKTGTWTYFLPETAPEGSGAVPKEECECQS
jgi:hypothetical protein